MISGNSFEYYVETWAVIAQAEGVLSVRDGISVQEAARRLRLGAAEFDLPLDEIARDVVWSRLSGARGGYSPARTENGRDGGTGR